MFTILNPCLEKEVFNFGGLPTTNLKQCKQISALAQGSMAKLPDQGTTPAQLEKVWQNNVIQLRFSIIYLIFEMQRCFLNLKN
jgi:hypothetical protein